ncbi:hypothetical protein WN944_006499 [Citrus x changshan-huyou]|uniref:Prolamin-like domain-containing protein n=1 Tax=Citrus x changshan-huyou TaxID=2935761 RepID=A0AAP0MP27_9ROSI
MTNIANVTSRNDRLNNNIKSGYDLATRLEVSGGLTECWNALMELKSCSNEIVIFFLNSQADIGPDCCRTIDIITRNCWSAMLTSLGFTAKEGNILRGYYDASSAPSPGDIAVISASGFQGFGLDKVHLWHYYSRGVNLANAILNN